MRHLLVIGLIAGLSTPAMAVEKPKKKQAQPQLTTQQCFPQGNTCIDLTNASGSQPAPDRIDYRPVGHPGSGDDLSFGGQ